MALVFHQAWVRPRATKGSLVVGGPSALMLPLCRVPLPTLIQQDELRKPGTLTECIEAAEGAMTVCARGSRTPLSRRSLCCWAARFRPAGPQRASADDQLV